MDKQNNKEQFSLLFLVLTCTSCVCIIAANLFEIKQIQVGPFNLAGGLLVFPISYIINDCTAEVWGYRRALVVVWLSFLMNFFFVGVGALCDIIPPAPYYNDNGAFHTIFGLAPRIAIASFIAFLSGSSVNAFVMSRMKARSKGKYFSLRAIVSTLAGESVDSIIFFPLALYGVIPTEAMPSLMLYQVLFKSLYEVIALPITIRVVRFVKHHEETDVYDDKISYNPLQIFKVIWNKKSKYD